MEATLKSDQKLISLILYSDATICDKLGKKKMHPIYLSLGNIPYHIRNIPQAKAIIGYLPLIEKNFSQLTNYSETFLAKQLSLNIRKCFHECMKILFNTLENDNITGIDLKL